MIRGNGQQEHCQRWSKCWSSQQGQKNNYNKYVKGSSGRGGQYILTDEKSLQKHEN